MKVSFSWLREHIALDLSVEELSKRLLSLGFEVASVERKGPQFRGVVTAKVLEVTKHPNADRLRLCTVDDGTTKFSVVCGAPNVAAGQSVALARVGAELPGGKKLGPAKIRGVESQGMLCSAAELGLEGSQDGILVLGESTPLGQDFAASLGPGDTILEVEITPNRPDCLSHRGLARELSAALNVPLKPLSVPALPAPSGDCPPIVIEDEKACPTYVGRLITGVKVGPSPAWLTQKLEAIGLRPINNVVDVTNFILHDVGQPLHAFDASRLAGPEIRVRWARAGETIKALDGKPYPLSDKNLLIADAARPAAIAGVMGGEESSVTEKTTAIVLESAYFAPPVVRKSSQTLRLKSDSSYRFERGTDPAYPAAASERAAALIVQLAGGTISKPRMAGAASVPQRTIATSAARLNEILGSSFPPVDVEAAIGRIGAVTKSAEQFALQVPSWRGDLETPWDLAEEAARLLGYDNVPTSSAPVSVDPAKETAATSIARKVKQRLQGLGLLEAYNYDFVSKAQVERARLDRSACRALQNPISDDWTLLRPDLLIGLLQNAVLNLRHGTASIRLFEVGTQYDLKGETLHAAAILAGPAASRFWRGGAAEADFFDAKGLVEELLAGVAYQLAPLKDSKKRELDVFFHPSEALQIRAFGGPVGTVGVLHPSMARAWDLERARAVLIDLDLSALMTKRTAARAFQPISPFPPAWRDLSFVCDAGQPYALVEAAVQKAGKPELQNLELIDVFSGRNMPAGKRSLTIRLTFGSLERTLTDTEVDAAIARVLAELKALGAELRG